MRYKQVWTGILAGLGLLALILDGQTALEGGRAGIDFCIRTVIPSLFPFFLLSGLLTDALSGSSLSMLRPLGKLCRIPQGAESLLIPGFLGGYPVGAQCIAAAYRAGQLPKEDAQRMLAFCNNAGPAFLFGMIASLFPHAALGWALWGIHVASALLTALLIPGYPVSRVNVVNDQKRSVSGTLHASLQVMATVCGWIILFRVLIAFLKKWVLWAFPVHYQTAFIGFLELSNGCYELPSVPDLGLRFLICSGILAFGGLCVTMQTVSVTRGLSLRFYFLGKALQTLFSITICVGILVENWIFFLLALLACGILLRKKQKKEWILPAGSCIMDTPIHGGRCDAVSKKNRTLLCLLPAWGTPGGWTDSLHEKRTAHRRRQMLEVYL